MLRYNSTIKANVGVCIDCPPDSAPQYLTAKRCQSHYRIHRFNVNKNKNTQRGIVKTGKQGVAKKEVGLERWFSYVATIIRATPYCMNCGEWIAPDYYRHASAHIFPKARFQSVATHPWNFLILGPGCGCHPKFDSSIDNAFEMKVWPEAVRRFKIFESEITEHHKYLDLFKSKIIEKSI